MNIVITGASSGIGFETALHLSQNPGTTIIAIARNKENLDILQRRTKELQPLSKLVPVVFDLESESFEELKEKILAFFKHVDVLINNAGALISKPFMELNNEDWLKMHSVNVMGPVKLIRTLVPYMGKERKSHIVNIGSMGGVQGSVKFPGLSAYSSSKAMLANITECLALEFAGMNIHVNCLALGSAQTEMLGKAFPGYIAPLTAQQMGEYVADFSIKANNYMNGQVISVSLSNP